MAVSPISAADQEAKEVPKQQKQLGTLQESAQEAAQGPLLHLAQAWKPGCLVFQPTAGENGGMSKRGTGAASYQSRRHRRGRGLLANVGYSSVPSLHGWETRPQGDGVALPTATQLQQPATQMQGPDTQCSLHRTVLPPWPSSLYKISYF